MLSLLLWAATACAQQTPLQNINVSATADVLNPVSLDDDKLNRLGVRSAELLVYGSIDHIFDGMVNVATHEEDGKYPVELHEAFISTSKLVPRSQIRAGKFFLNVGRLNNYHQHDWPFISAPKMQREFFTPDQANDILHAESAIDTGVEYSYLMPFENLYMNVTVGVTNGYCYGHCEEQKERPTYPTHYVHPVTFFDLGGGRGLQLGATYLGRKDADHTRTDLSGLDVTYKNRVGKRLKWLVQGEAFYQAQKPQDENWSEKVAGYVFTQYGLDERWSVGLRADGYTQLHRRDADTDEEIGNLTYAFVPQISWQPSEFSRWRLAYAHEVATAEHAHEERQRMIQLQYTFFLGAHPAHDF